MTGATKQEILATLFGGDHGESKLAYDKFIVWCESLGVDPMVAAIAIINHADKLMHHYTDIKNQIKRKQKEAYAIASLQAAWDPTDHVFRFTPAEGGRTYTQTWKQQIDVFGKIRGRKMRFAILEMVIGAGGSLGEYTQEYLYSSFPLADTSYTMLTLNQIKKNLGEKYSLLTEKYVYVFLIGMYLSEASMIAYRMYQFDDNQFDDNSLEQKTHDEITQLYTTGMQELYQSWNQEASTVDGQPLQQFVADKLATGTVIDLITAVCVVHMVRTRGVETVDMGDFSHFPTPRDFKISNPSYVALPWYNADMEENLSAENDWWTS